MTHHSLSQVYHRSNNRKVAETAEGFGGFPVSMHGFIGNNHNNGEWRDAYERKIPGNYQVDENNEHVDQFTANIMRNYATEGVTKDGKPNGYFFITKDQAKKLAAEVVEKHLEMKGDQAKLFLKKKFNETWEHYDVNDEGNIDA